VYYTPFNIDAGDGDFGVAFVDTDGIIAVSRISPNWEINRSMLRLGNG